MSQKKARVDVFQTYGIKDRDSFEAECIRAVKDKDLKANFTIGNMIAMFEEETLENLKDEIVYNRYGSSTPSSPRSFGTLNSNNFLGGLRSVFTERFNELAIKLNVNIEIFIGHINYCVHFLQDIQTSFAVNPITEPTIVILIGCLGKKYATDANNDEDWKKQEAAVMAFDNLVHIFDNKIYACEVSHKSLPNMFCDYDDVEKDYKEFTDKHGENDHNIFVARKNTTSELVKCCQSKLDRFSSVFLKNLRKRNCVEFTMDKIEEKIRGLLREDGKINREKLNNEQNYIFSLADGIPCTTEANCAIHNPYENSIQIAEDFDRRSSTLNLYLTFKKFIEDKQYENDKEEFILKKLQELKLSEKEVIYYYQDDWTFLHLFAYYGYPKCLEYILKKFDNLPVTIENENGFIFTEYIINNPFDSEEVKLRLLMKVFEKYPDVLKIDNNREGGIGTNYDMIYLAVKFHYLSIVQFFSQVVKIELSTKKYSLEDTYKNINLLFVAALRYPLVGEEAYQLIKLLLAEGVDPNENNELVSEEYRTDWLSFFFLNNIPIINSKILREICNYGFNHLESLEYWTQKVKEALKNNNEMFSLKKSKIAHYYPDGNITPPHPMRIEQRRLNDNLYEIVDLVLAYPERALKPLLETLEECKKIMIRGRKTNAQLNRNVEKTLKRARNNLQNKTRRINAIDRIPEKYKEIDEYIKSVGAKFTKQEKKEFREEGIAILRNTETNALQRLQTLENLLNQIQQEAAMRGGRRRTRKLRKL